MSFDTPITYAGPFRTPAQMLADQEYGGHTSVHDDAQAAELGLAGAPIEGPTHFSQFDPLAVHVWGRDWFERGCLSAHFVNMVVEGQEVRASLTPAGADRATIDAHLRDGSTVLTGTATLGPDAPTELDARRRRAEGDPGELFVVDQLSIGRHGEGATVRIAHDEHNGALYPFTLDEKLARITEPST